MAVSVHSPDLASMVRAGLQTDWWEGLVCRLIGGRDCFAD